MLDCWLSFLLFITIKDKLYKMNFIKKPYTRVQQLQEKSVLGPKVFFTGFKQQPPAWVLQLFGSIAVVELSCISVICQYYWVLIWSYFWAWPNLLLSLWHYMLKSCLKPRESSCLPFKYTLITLGSTKQMFLVSVQNPKGPSSASSMPTQDTLILASKKFHTFKFIRLISYFDFNCLGFPPL